METQPTSSGLEHFFQHVRAAPRRVLLLDYDGTLAPFRVERDQATPYPDVRDLLNMILAAGHTRLVIVSGRTASEIVRLAGLAQPVEVWGCHGAERLLPDGSSISPELDRPAAAGLEQARRWAEQSGCAERCEPKLASIAFHWRGETPEAARQLHDLVMDSWLPLTEGTGLALHAFDGGVELRVARYTKGGAVRRILAEERNDAAIAYLGDDMTDEDAFRALAHHGLSVLVRAQPRPTSAQHWLRPPEELAAFVRQWHQTASDTVERVNREVSV
ncbi:MAG TPA: trehalose-phosphatase [Roseiflexaceae bacterium]|nr:trehalose-phosphatase [Roseiflexaceae bacterium]